MAKSLFMFSTKIWMFLSEIPPIFLFVLCILNFEHSTLAGGYVPLMILMAGVSIFIFVFLFRAVKLSRDEIKRVGKFTGGDRVTLKKDMTLTLTLLKRRRIKIEVFGDSGSEPIYPWLKSSPAHDIRLFSAKVIGRHRKAKKILSFFGAPVDSYDSLLVGEKLSVETKTLLLFSASSDDGRQISIKFLKTL